MAVIQSIDGPNRLIYLHPDTVDATWEPVELYREYRALRRTDEALRGYNPFLRMEGNIPKGGGKATPRYMLMIEGTRIRPYDAAGVSTVAGEIITDDQAEPFDYSVLTQPMIIDKQPTDAEIVYVEIPSAIQDRLDYGGVIQCYEGSGYSGQVHPYGTYAQPVDNLLDIAALSASIGIFAVHTHGALSQGGADLARLHMTGANPEVDWITLDGSGNAGTRFVELFITGQANGSMLARDSVLAGVTDFRGILHQCALATGGITIDAAATSVLQILSCYSAVAGATRPELNINGSLAPISCRDYFGGLTVTNWTAGQAGSFDFVSGTLEFASTVTNGSAVVGPHTEVIDNSGPGFNWVRRKRDLDVNVEELHTRFDLDADAPNTYSPDGSSISNSKFSLNKDGSGTVTRGPGV